MIRRLTDKRPIGDLLPRHARGTTSTDDLALREVSQQNNRITPAIIWGRGVWVCHTNLHAAEGDWSFKPTLPFFPGHEGVGTGVVVGLRRWLTWFDRDDIEFGVAGDDTR